MIVIVLAGERGVRFVWGPGALPAVVAFGLGGARELTELYEKPSSVRACRGQGLLQHSFDNAQALGERDLVCSACVSCWKARGLRYEQVL